MAVIRQVANRPVFFRGVVEAESRASRCRVRGVGGAYGGRSKWTGHADRPRESVFAAGRRQGLSAAIF